MSTLLRAARIGRVLLRYRLDDLLDDTPAERWLKLMRPFVPRAAGDIAARSRGARLRLALQELGPIFVKFGQILSTRRDLLPPDLVDELALLQDQVAPFDGDTARSIVESELQAPVDVLFASFDTEPLASASIAQVHAATLHPVGDAPPREVVVKVLRPGIDRRIAQDVGLLRSLAALVDRTHPNADKIRPREVVAEIENTLAAELDLQREGANASVLRRNWLHSPDLYVPEPIWSHTTQRVSLERVRGINSDDIAALDRRHRPQGARGQGVRCSTPRCSATTSSTPTPTPATSGRSDRRDNPRFIALDFGIMGQLSTRTSTTSPRTSWRSSTATTAGSRSCVEAGWMPAHIRIEELEAAARAVCEPYFTRPLSEISLGGAGKLFRTARRYERPQPQLILMQKTLLTISIGRLLDPKIDIWAVPPGAGADPGRALQPSAAGRQLRRRVPEMMTRAPEVPRLAARLAGTAGRGPARAQMRSPDVVAISHALRGMQRSIVAAILGVGLLIVAAVLYALEAGGPAFLGVPLSSWVAGIGGLWAIRAALPRR